MADKLPPLCIYHANCADGFAAAWVVRYALSSAEFVAANYGSEPPDVTGRIVYIVDFSYPRDVLLAMASQAERIVVLDHHKTAAEQLVDLPANVTARFDMNRSGCMLAWDHFFPAEKPPTLLLHVEDRDLWRFELPGTREVLAAVFSHPYDFKIWDGLTKEDLHSSLFDDGYAIERKHNKDVESLITSARITEIAGHQVPTVNLPPTMASDAGAALAIGQPFAAVYWDTRTGRQYSLRSATDGMDVAAIAQLFGGGGHKHAAGFKVAHGHPLSLGTHEEVARLQSVVERDRTVFCNLIVELKNAVRARHHLSDENARSASGYTYDEDGFIQEFAAAYDEIISALDRAQRVFQSFTDCPRGEAVRAAQSVAAEVLAAPDSAASTAVPDRWLPIDSAPDDGTPHVRGLHVFSNDDGGFLYWDAYVGRIDTEDGIFYDLGGDVIGWEAMDFSHWRPLPPAPALDGKEKG